MDITDLLDRGYAWTGDRLAVVTAADLAAPTPCGRWCLRDLLDHMVETLGVFADAVRRGPARVTPTGRPGTHDAWVAALADLARRSSQGWRAAGALDRTYALPFGTMPGPIAASANLLELVVHGWDVGRATGEGVDIPVVLADPILTFARAAIGDAGRGEQFAADLGTGDTPSDRLVAYLGRKPR